jgi:hypothetical protein
LWGNLEDLEGTLRARGGLASELERPVQRDDGRIVRARLRETLAMNVMVDVQPRMQAAVGLSGLVAEETDELYPA